MKTITIGVIGAGLIGRKHLAKLAGRDDYDLVGIADVNADKVAGEYPATRVFADYRKLLDEARPEAVIIASPNQLHAEQGIECARRGIHILIEKPVTDTVETAASLIEEVRKAGIQSLVGHHRRHHQQVRTLKATLGDKRIGDVVGVSAIWATHKPVAYFEVAPWRSQAGGGPILINLIHEIDFLRFHNGRDRRRGSDCVEPPARLCGGGYVRGADRIRQRRARHFLHQRQRRLALDVRAGLGEAPEFPFSGESSYRFLGRSGSIEFPALVQWSQAGGAQDWNKPIQSRRIHASSVDPYIAQLDHFRDIIRGKARSLQPVEDGARSLIATLAVAEAAASGRRVDLRNRYETLASPAAKAGKAI